MIDTYAAHDFNNPNTLDRAYTTQAVREDQLGVNLAIVDLKGRVDSSNFRIALQHGTSVRVNYAAEEQAFARYIHEAYWSQRLTNRLTFDFGVYTSHFGFENFVAYENWTYTRSLVAEYLPYYESGAKLTYQFDSKNAFQLHLLRGWQNISSSEDPALGFQYSHKFSEGFKFTYANFTGDVSGLRIFNDFILAYDLSKKFQIAFQYDVGRQVRHRPDSNSGSQSLWWHGTSFMTRYTFNDKFALSTRIESFYDPNQAVVNTLNSQRFNVIGFSFNIDYQIYPKLFWRNEYRITSGKESIYPTEDGYSKSNTLMVTALLYSFDLM